nr:S-layer homology domain-containing protein [uncultured Flavonifractor sp.]
MNKPTVYYPAEAEDKYAGADSALVESGLVSTPSEESEPDNQYALSITEDTASVEVGKTVQLTVTSIVPTDATLEWSSSNEQVATVVKGTITGVKAGSATITASIQLNGITLVSDTCVVTVSEVPPSTGGDSYEPSTPSGDYLVSVDKTTGGKVTVNPGRADKGDTVTITVKPDKGYELDELTVTAKNGDTVKLTEKSNGKFTFKMPGSKVTVEAVFVKENSEKPVVTLPFADVNKGDWFYDAVEYVYGNDLMNGTSATAFSPYLTTSRAMMLTMLARYDGVDTTTGSTWYEAGAVWAVAEGISDGTNLEADLTREQLVTMLWRYTGSPVVESDLSAYPDGGAVSDWAVNAMIWATQTGVITGNGAGALAPQGTATRAEVATILARFCAGK